MHVLIHDLRSGWRVLARQWQSSVLAVLALTVGIGATTAALSLTRGVLLKPLPYKQPDQLVMVWSQHKHVVELERGLATPDDVLRWRSQNTSLADLALVEPWYAGFNAQPDLVMSDTTERLRGGVATPNFFELLGVPAAIGRAFSGADDGDVVILSDRLWRRRFDADPRILDREVLLVTGSGLVTETRNRRSRPFRVIGVLPPGVQFTYPDETELWLPLSWDRVEREPRDAILYAVVARLRPGVSAAQAEREIAALYEAAASELPHEPFRQRFTARVEPVREHVAGHLRPAIVLLSATAGLLLLVACVNVAGVLFARAMRRRSELATRCALGASRARLMRQLFTEDMVLVVAGGVAGVAVAFVTMGGLRAAMPPMMPRAAEIGMDGWVLALTALTIVLAGVLTSLLPSWYASVLDLRRILNEGSLCSTPGAAALRWRRRLITVQVSVLCGLLVAAGLLVHSFRNLQRIDPGFDATGILTMEMRLLGPGYRDVQRLRRFEDELLSLIRALPGVEQAGMTSAVPFRGVDWMTVVSRADADLPNQPPGISANKRQIDPEYLSVMGMPLRAGRSFSPQDTATSQAVTIVSESLARRLFGDEDPLGRSVVDRQTMEIVGVVGDVRHVNIHEPPMPAYYVPRAQQSSELICLVIRSTVPHGILVPTVLETIRGIDPHHRCRESQRSMPSSRKRCLSGASTRMQRRHSECWLSCSRWSGSTA